MQSFVSVALIGGAFELVGFEYAIEVNSCTCTISANFAEKSWRFAAKTDNINIIGNRAEICISWMFKHNAPVWVVW